MSEFEQISLDRDATNSNVLLVNSAIHILAGRDECVFGTDPNPDETKAVEFWVDFENSRVMIRLVSTDGEDE